jgi:CRP-like cAMP-binding protein
MYVVHSGSVALTRQLKDREAVLAIVPPGEFFGEMAIVNNRPRSATATVREDAWLLVIDSRTFEAMIRGKAEIAVRMIKAMANRLEQANLQIELLLLKDVNHRIVQCLRRLAETQGTQVEGGAGVFLPLTLAALAGRVALDEEQVVEVLERLRQARLVLTAAEAGYDVEGFVVPEVGRLVDFLEFLEMKERFGQL